MKHKGWTSRKFLVGVGTFIALLLNEFWGFEIDPANLALIILPIVAWITGETITDLKK